MVRAKNYGRLGNVLFQVCAAISYSLKHNLDLSVPTITDNPFWNPLYFQSLVNPNWVEGIEDIVITEPSFRHFELPFEEHWRDKQIVLDGYFQSWKYIEEHRKEILYLLDLRYKLKPKTASIHIRRGDYLQYPEKHPPYSLEYLQKAMQYMINEKGVEKFEVYSDDTMWCLDNLSQIPNVKVFEKGDELNDLVEASCCEHNICSSSTFSFWIAWLNKNHDKCCIFPELWFTEGYHLDTTDLLHPDWIKM